jgi:hypothetical protein
MQYKNTVLLGTFGQQERSLGTPHHLVRDRKHAQVESRVYQPPRLLGGDIDTQLLEQAQDRPGLDRPRGVVIAGNKYDGCFGECFPKPLKLPKCKDDRGVGWPDGMEEIPSKDDDVRVSLDDAVDGRPECVGYIGFSLVNAVGGLPVVLPDAEVGVRDVGQFHGWRMVRIAVKSKNLQCGRVTSSRAQGRLLQA